MTTRLLLAAALCASLGAAPALARDLAVATAAGLLAAQRETYFSPFTLASGVALQETVWDGALATLRNHAEAWDLVLADGAALLSGCTEGLLVKLDWQALGGRDHYQPPAATDCGAGAFTRTTVLAWDRDKFQGTATWQDFWDVAKFPGKRGMQRGARTNLEIALMADGVAPGDVYRALRTDEGVDRAFHKLEQIKPYLVWWQSPAQAPKLIGTGEVLLSTAPSDRVAAANLAGPRHLGSQPAGALYTIDAWVVPRASPNQPDAMKLLAFLGDPARQASFSAATGLGVLARGVAEGLSADRLAASPNNPALLSSALQIDEQFWHDNADRLDERFDAWLAH